MKKLNWLNFLIFGASAVFLFLIYWSSTLIEADLKILKKDLKSLKEQTALLSQKVRFDTSHVSSEIRGVKKTEEDSSFPNLLKNDPYFSHILPKLLEEDFSPKGIVNEAIIGRPDHLHPFNGFKDISRMLDMCVASLSDQQFGKYETFSPDLAVKLEARPRQDNPQIHEYWVFLREDAYWQPLQASHFPDSFKLNEDFFEKHQVTAHDFKFFYDALMNPFVSEAKAAALRTYYGDIESFTVVDDFTFIVRWKPHKIQNENESYKIKYTSLNLTASLQPLPRFVYQYFSDGKKIIDEEEEDIYRKSSLWAQNFTHHWAKNIIVSCGPYLFDGMNDEGISFRRNPEYHNPLKALVEGMQFRFKESFDAIWQDFKAGKLDFCTLSPNQLAELDAFLESEEYQAQKVKGLAIQTLDYVDLSYFYLGWNESKPFFNSPKVRKALSMAIDRERIIEQNLNQMAVSISGPFFRYSPSYDDTIFNIPFNPDKARVLLEEEGWVDMDGDGVREKISDGKKIAFTFKLYYFVKSLSSKVIAEYISWALKDIGVDCQLVGLDLADLSRQFDDKSFDAIFMGWKLSAPPEDPRQLWHSSGAKEKGSSNAIGFSNPEIDTLIDKLNYEYNKEERLSLYRQFHRIIHEEQPYTFLYTPKVRLLYRDYVKNLFIPRERQDLLPGSNASEPNTLRIWLEKQ